MSSESSTKSILHNFYLITREALKAYKPGAIDNVTITDEKTEYIGNPRVISFHFDHTGEKKRGSIPITTSRTVRKALLFFATCDLSCWFIEREASILLADLGATVTWVRVEPRPRIVLTRAPPKPPFVYHSVLLITLQDGRRFVVDPTGQQFGYPKESWWTDEATYQQKYMATGSFDSVCSDYKVMVWWFSYKEKYYLSAYYVAHSIYKDLDLTAAKAKHVRKVAKARFQELVRLRDISPGNQEVTGSP